MARTRLTVLPLLLLAAAFYLLNVLQLSFVGGLATPARTTAVSLEAAKKTAAKKPPAKKPAAKKPAAKKAAPKKAAPKKAAPTPKAVSKKAPKAPSKFTNTEVLKAVFAASTGYAALSATAAKNRRKLITEAIKSYWSVVGSGLKKGGSIALNGYVGLRVVKKPAVKKGTVIEAFGGTLKSKGKKATTKVVATPLKPLLKKSGVAK